MTCQLWSVTYLGVTNYLQILALPQSTFRHDNLFQVATGGLKAANNRADFPTKILATTAVEHFRVHKEDLWLDLEIPLRDTLLTHIRGR